MKTVFALCNEGLNYFFLVSELIFCSFRTSFLEVFN